MAKLLQKIYAYKIYPKKTVRCGCCHREFVSEPFVMQTDFLRGGKTRRLARCWRCVRSREACELIMNKWPGIFQIQRHGQFYHLYYQSCFNELFGGPKL